MRSTVVPRAPCWPMTARRAWRSGRRSCRPRGGDGAYVSDLWVAGDQRGSGLGMRLLAAVRDAAAAEFGAVFLRLAVYDDNAAARRFYDRLGFRPKPDEIWLTLEGPALEALA
ncbi:GNAT family N-acetyltransferase [Gemmobacter lanyuensis]